MMKFVLVSPQICPEVVAYQLRRLRPHSCVGATNLGPQNAEQLGIHHFAEYADLLKEKVEHDAVVVLSDLSTMDILIQAAQAKKHILVEASVLTASDRQSITDICHENGVRIFLANAARYSPYAQAILFDVATGHLGETGLVRIHHWLPESTTDSQLAHAVIREAEFAAALFDAPLDTMQISINDATVMIHCGFQGGGMAMLDCANICSKENTYDSVSVIGSKGAAYADDHRNSNLLFGNDSLAAIQFDQNSETNIALMFDFFERVEKEMPFPKPALPLAILDQLAALMNSFFQKARALSSRKGQWIWTNDAFVTVPVGDEYRPSESLAAGTDNFPRRASDDVAQYLPAIPKSDSFPIAVLSVVKHCYVPRGMFSHPRFVPAVVADEPDQPDWVHERNKKFAAEFDVPYVRDVERAVREFGAKVAVVSSEAERHCALSVKAADAGLHVVQDKPMSTVLSECDRVVEAVERNGVKFMMWNRNGLPAILQARNQIRNGNIGDICEIHVDFYFAKDAGPPIGTRSSGEPPLDWLEYLIAAHETGADGGVGKKPMGELEVEGIYPLAYIHLLTGAVPTQVFARTTAHFHQLHADNQVDDLSTVSMQLQRGIRGTLCMGRIGNASHPDIGEIRIHVRGTSGSLVIAEPRPEVSVYYRGQSDAEFPNRRIANQNDWLLADNFAYAIDHDQETILNARVSRAICAAVQASIESGQTGRVVDVQHS